MVAGMAFAFCFYRMHHGHGHLNLIWCFWIPLSFVAIERGSPGPRGRGRGVGGIVVLQALATWYQRVDPVADLLSCCGSSRWSGGRCHRRVCDARGGRPCWPHSALIWPFARRYFICTTESPAYAAGRPPISSLARCRPRIRSRGQWLLGARIKAEMDLGELTVYPDGFRWSSRHWSDRVAANRRCRPAPQPILHCPLAVVAAVLALGPLGERWRRIVRLEPLVRSRMCRLSLFRIPPDTQSSSNLALAVLAASACAASHRRFGVAGRMLSLWRRVAPD